jgi:MFS family permease
LIAQSVPPEALGRAFGFHRMGDSFGAVIGPLLGLWALSAMDNDLHAALWWAVVPACISAGLVFFVREHRPATEPVMPAAAPPTPAVAAQVATKTTEPLPRPFWMVTAVLVAIALVNFSDTLLLLRVSDLGFSTTKVVLAYVVFNAVYTLGAYPAGALTDRWPRPVVYAIGLLAFGVGYLGLGLVHGGAPVFVLAAVYGLFPAFTDGVGKAWIASLVPRAHLGRAQGTFQALNNGAILLAGVWAGLTWRVGAGRGTVPLVLAGAVGFAAAVVMIVFALSPRWRSPRIAVSP